ncbi:PREDICTED: uncharacterized protein LOC105458763 isoform X2 [Wasmannia auropunctata]|uniref:uncharacterized protein LOC105458763 isoform X2 n=1 Tax=Wasmannia auropunctata TaxID=64793 RepID=UPI0005ED7E0E|nr:PREDICTED: uncharacterized protein LOC105458763 isoform X2 [Wasmannia auropunctata]
MYFLNKKKNTYKITKRKTKGWIICSNKYTHLKEIARNLMNDLPKIYLKRIDFTNATSSSIKSSNNESTLSNTGDLVMSFEISDEKLDFDNDSINSTSIPLEESLETSSQQKIVNEPNLNISFPVSEVWKGSLNTPMAEIDDQDESTLSNTGDLVMSFEISDEKLDFERISEDNDENRKNYDADAGYVVFSDLEDSNNNQATTSDYVVSNDLEDSDNDQANTFVTSRRSSEKSNTTNDSLDISKHIYEKKKICDDTNLVVPTSHEKGKQYFCFYCKKFQSKLSRHLENIHKNEANVKKFISFPKGNSERKAIIQTIRQEGNFLYNTSSQFNTGELLVSRRPNVNKPASCYGCCSKCKGYFSKNSLRHHFRNCNQKSIGRRVLQLSRKIQARVHSKANDIVRDIIFPVLRDDDVCRIIRYDELVILRANSLCYRKHKNPRYEVIRAELRLLGRYLISVKKFNSNINDFASIYHPRHYDSCILAAKDVAQLNPNTNKFKSPSVAIRIGYLLKTLGNLLSTEYIKRDDNKRLRNTEKFLKLLKQDYEITINTIAQENTEQNKKLFKSKVLKIKDIQKIYKLYDYLKELKDMLES